MLPRYSLVLTTVFILVFLFLIFRFFWREPENQNAIKRLFRKTKAAFDRESAAESPRAIMSAITQPPAPPPPPTPTTADIMRYRFHYGTNIGSVFILERWLTPSMFPASANGQGELTAVQSWVQAQGIQKTQALFENHWKTYVSDADLDWLKNVAMCTTVRLPIGWFILGPPYCVATAFDKVSAVYQNAWTAVQALVKRCRDRGIGVLIDLHGLPGGANTGIHSGTDSGKAEFWTSIPDRQLATRCLCFISQQVRCMEGVIGIQLVNEAIYQAKDMYVWYDNVLSELARIDPTMPIYISDAWDLSTAITWAQQKNTVKAVNTNPVVIDTHIYYCFSDANKQESPQQIIASVPTALTELDGKYGDVVDRGAAQVLVGEYSCVLDTASWALNNGTPQSQVDCSFGTAQSQRFQQRAGGSCFWTYRMDWMDGGEWGFKQMAEQGDIQPPKSLTLCAADVQKSAATAKSQQAQLKQAVVSAHDQYWDTKFPGTYEHWRFAAGWDVGYCDALAFFTMRCNSSLGLQGADKIGMLDLWVLKRLRESGQSGAFVWEIEQGLRQGIRDFYSCVGV